MKGLQLNNLSCHYRGHVLFKELSAHFAPGLIALSGVNGSGKSTLLRVLAGINQPQQGDVLFDGLSLYQSHPKAKIGYLPYLPSLYPHLTVEENIVWLKRLQQCQAPYTQAMTFMREYEISHFKNKLFAKLSDGQKKWIHLLVSMMHSPKLLILDEPCSSLDPKQRQNLWALLKSWQMPDRVILFSTHHVSEIASVANEIVFLQEGQLYFDKSTVVLPKEVPCL
ncbi:MAG: ATP-binding cassette domain-containing protein [Candidatus Berkiella sp.]